MPIKFFQEETKFNFKNRKIIKKGVNDVIVQENFKTGNINYIFTSDNYLLNINKEYLNHNYFTDIVTFNYCQNSVINGDIFISIDTVKNNSARFNVLFLEELYRVIIHGALHLIGYDDQNEEEKKIMRQKENYYLERLKKLF